MKALFVTLVAAFVLPTIIWIAAIDTVDQLRMRTVRPSHIL